MICNLIALYIMRPDGMIVIVSYEPTKPVSLKWLDVICQMYSPVLCKDERKLS